MDPDKNLENSLPLSRLEEIPTRWSLILNAHTQGKPENANLARQALVLRYAPSIRRYIGGILSGNPEDADEIAQEVVVRLMKGDFAGADPIRGRFRDLLKAATRNMVLNHWAKSKVRKSANVDWDLMGKDEIEDPKWQKEWQKNILDQVWTFLDSEAKSKVGDHQVTVLRLRVEFPDDSAQELAEKFLQKTGLQIKADHLRQLLRRARLHFAEVLVREVALGLSDPSPERVEDELSNLGLLVYVKDFLAHDWKTNGILR